MSPAGMLFLKILMVILGLAILLCMVRAVIGPGIPNRIIGVNVIGTKTTTLLVMVGVVFHEGMFFDIAMIYAMLLFVATLAFVKFMEAGTLEQ